MSEVSNLFDQRVGITMAMEGEVPVHNVFFQSIALIYALDSFNETCNTKHLTHLNKNKPEAETDHNRTNRVLDH